MDFGRSLMRFVFEGTAVNVARKSIEREELPLPGAHLSLLPPNNGVWKVEFQMIEGFGRMSGIG